MTWHILLVECETAYEKKVGPPDDTFPEGSVLQLELEKLNIAHPDSSLRSYLLL